VNVALVGAGVIGSGWAGRLVASGHDVAVFDPHPETKRRVAETIAAAERAWRQLLRVPRSTGTVSFAGSLAGAVGGAAVIQESAGEDESLKRGLLAEIDRHAEPDALVCSSTSGLLPTRLQAGMTRPERFVVGHPFNPVYLLPLVEVCAGTATAPEAVERACSFYESIGMKPLRVRREVDGFVADRLLEALWREALWLVHDGVATTGEIDDAIRLGPGLRWAQMGTFLTYRIAGGEAGMRHFLAQFGPALQWPWTKLVEVPELTDSFVDRLAAQSDDQAEGLSIAELERRRDDNLVALLGALRARDEGAGQLLRQHEERLRATASPARSDALRLHEAEVQPSWIDYNGHMTESRYLQVFADATDAFLGSIGLDDAYLAGGHSLYTVESHLRHLREVSLGTKLVVETQVLQADSKRVRLFHAMHDEGGDTVATGEHMLLHVDIRDGRTTSMLEPLAGNVAAIASAHAALPWPEAAGRSIGVRSLSQIEEGPGTRR
jgi:carnitine 3-dehydrogenase